MINKKESNSESPSDIWSIQTRIHELSSLITPVRHKDFHQKFRSFLPSFRVYLRIFLRK